MIRVLQLPDTIERRNGRMSVIMNVYRKIDRKKLQFDFLCTKGSSEDYKQEILDLGGHVYYLSPDQMSLRMIKVAVNNCLSNTDYSFIHYHAISKWGIALNVAKKYGVPTIVHSHATTLSDNPLKSIRNRLFSVNVFFANKKVAVSPEAGRRLFMSNDFEYIPNMINYSSFSYSTDNRKRIRAKLNVSDDEALIGVVGRISKQKNQQYALKALSALTQSNQSQKYRLVFIGDDSTPDKTFLNTLKTQAKELHLESQILFTGMVSNVNQYYSALDIMWMPSLFEGLPTAAVEAQSNGLFVLLSDKITKSTDITGSVKFLAINKDSVPLWAKETVSHSGHRNKQAISIISKSAFNEKSVVSQWLDLYR